MPDQERIANDDWVDQDLLTKDEAAQRLATEIAELTAQLKSNGPADQAVERRLRALKEAHTSMTQG